MRKILELAIVVVFAQVIVGRPQYSPTIPSEVPSEPECITKFREVFDIVNKEEFKEVCKPTTRKECVTLNRQQCDPYEDQECTTKYRDDCQTLYRDNCYDDFKDVQERYTEDVCVDTYVKVCEKAWIEQGYNDKVWAEDPSTCKELPKTECNPVDKTRTVKEKYTKCDKVPYQECKKVPEENCVTVTKQNCYNVPYEDCKDVPDEICETKHVQVPSQVTRRVPVRMCKDEQGQFVEQTTSPVGEIPDVEIIGSLTDPRKVDIDIRSGVSEAPVEGGEEPEDSDRIVFGK